MADSFWNGFWSIGSFLSPAPLISSGQVVSRIHKIICRIRENNVTFLQSYGSLSLIANIFNTTSPCAN
jgi:hypothetical protein